MKGGHLRPADMPPLRIFILFQDPAQKNADGHEVNQHIGVSRSGKTTKLHAVVDGLGNPLVASDLNLPIQESQSF